MKEGRNRRSPSTYNEGAARFPKGSVYDPAVRNQLKYDGTCAETRFRLSRETGPVHLNRPGGRGVSSVDCWQPRCAASAVIMLDTPCSEVV
jgi:hypothetical protein